MSQADSEAIHSFLGKQGRHDASQDAKGEENQQTKRARPVNVSLALGEFSEWEVTNQYEILSKLGRGSYGEVVKAKNRVTEAIVAIKQMKHVFDDTTDATRAYREIHILRNLRHPAIVDLQNVMCPSLGPTTATFEFMSNKSGKEAAGNLYLVFEYMDSDLQRILKFSNDPLGDMHVRFIMYQLLDGVRFIHENNVIHRDLKPANILVLCQTCRVKIADFGLSRVVGTDLIVRNNDGRDVGSEMTEAELPTPIGPIHSSASQRRPSLSTSQPDSIFPIRPVNLRRGLTRHVVTRWYRAPEIILLQPYTAAVDIWSLGCIFAELLGMCLASASKRRALFPGESCGELSAEDLFVPTKKVLAANSSGKNLASVSQDENDHHSRILRQSYAAERSQLNVIFDILGTPSEEDLSYLDQETAKAIRSMPRKSGLVICFFFRFYFFVGAIYCRLQCWFYSNLKTLSLIVDRMHWIY
jgi:mitogen-activated protein kinase 1/3